MYYYFVLLMICVYYSWIQSYPSYVFIMKQCGRLMNRKMTNKSHSEIIQNRPITTNPNNNNKTLMNNQSMVLQDNLTIKKPTLGGVLFSELEIQKDLFKNEEQEEDDTEWEEGEIPWDFVDPDKNSTTFDHNNSIRRLRFSHNELERIVFLVM